MPDKKDEFISPTSLEEAEERAEEVLKKAREIDDRERGMFPFIREHKSIQKAIELFGRI